MESRLQAALAGRGSPLYALTWKPWAMESGPPICALRASAPRTSDSGCGGERSGWPTPIVNDAGGSTHCYGKTLPDGTRERHLKLPGAVQLAGWPTPDASAFEAKDLERLEARRAGCKERTGNGNGFGLTLGQAVPLLAGWAAPTTRDHKDGAADGTAPTNCLLGRQVWDVKGAARLTSTGEMLTGSDAGMDGGGRLNPRHACWLMGYPHEWDDIAQTVTLPPRGRALRAKAGKHGA